MTFHPAFLPLHARLCGFDSELGGVPAHTLLALYPVELASYEPFLHRFYANPCVDIAAAHEIYRTVQGVPIHTLEQVIMKIADQNWSVKNGNLGATLPKQLERFVSELEGEPRKRVEVVGIQRQLEIMVRSLLILSSWNEEAFGAQKLLIQYNFMLSVSRLTEFFGASLLESTP